MADEQGRKLIKETLPGETLSLTEFEYDTLDSAIERLTAIRDRYPGEVLRFAIHYYPYSNDDGYYQLQRERRETDEELATRLGVESEQQRKNRERELAELDRLRKLYPDA